MPTKLEEVAVSLRERVEALPDPQPAFDLRVGWAADYDGLFEGRCISTGDAGSILTQAQEFGRVLVVGRGGGAKTVLLTRAAKLSFEKGLAAVFIALKDWTSADNKRWTSIENPSDRISYLFEHFSGVPLLPRDFTAFSPETGVLVVVDGLNEVNSRIGQQIVNALDEYARFALSTSVIVSDRLVRRDFLRPLRWRLGHLLSLETAQVENVVSADERARELYASASESERSLLTTPYFLNAFLQGGKLATSITDQMHQYFSSHAISDTELDTAADAAFKVYANASRTFPLSEFRTAAGASITDRLLAAGAIVTEGDLGFFDHHLKHDYLVSRYLVSDPTRWSSLIFATITFDASSFETIVMAMEQIDNSAIADDLLRRLYDWNIYGAGYSIAEGRSSRVSAEMQRVILAMFAERKWDLIIATAQRAMDTLRLIDSEESREFLAANSLTAVFGLVGEGGPASGWFAAWRDLFTKPLKSAASADDVALLLAPDSVLGWTSANVLRRLNCTDAQQEQIRGLTQSDDFTVAWRAAHVLGAYPSDENQTALVKCLSSDSTNVRFGATRSLVEMAALGGGDFAIRVFQSIAENIVLVRAFPSCLGEFERAIFIDNHRVPQGWTRAVSTAIIELQRSSTGIEDRERWDQVLARLVSAYGV